MSREHDFVVLTSDVPAHHLVEGDVGTVVHVHADSSAVEVEFATLTGQAVAVLTLRPIQFRPVGNRDINHMREIPCRVASDLFGNW